MTEKDWNYRKSAERNRLKQDYDYGKSADWNLVERARARYPHTPEHFRTMVEQAVAVQMEEEKRQKSVERRQKNIEQRRENVERRQEKEQQEYGVRVEPQESKANNRKGNIRTGNIRTVASKNRKKSWHKMLLPLAASLVLGGAALAAGGYFLYQRMMEKGYTQKEAELLLVTEPEQQVTELTGIVYPDGPTKEKEWKKPLLTIREAYFDGNTLYFLAEGSEESANYELYLRDHGSVSGQDGITSLEKLEADRLYLGEITLMDSDAAEKIIEDDSAEVVMTAIAYPKYDGNILYTWKDAEAYDEIFGIGAFEYKEYGLCYVLPQEDVTIGYTPHQITMQVPLTEEAKAVIEQYRTEAQGTLSVSGGNGQEESTSEEGMHGAVNTSEYENNKAAQAASISVEESHITATLPGTERNLYIDAEVVQGAAEVYTGILEMEKVDPEALMDLYQSESKDQWIRRGDADSSAIYQKKCEPGKEAEFCELVLEHLGIPASAAGYDDSLNTETYQTILAKPLLEGLTVAWKSQCVSICNLVLEDGILTSITAPQKMKVTEKNTADLADMQMILEKLAEYVAAGEITMIEGDQPVYEIQLEYYVDLTRNGIVFRPIWNFKAKALWDGTEKSISAENYFYIDAITGALIRDCYGY